MWHTEGHIIWDTWTTRGTFFFPSLFPLRHAFLLFFISFFLLLYLHSFTISRKTPSLHKHQTSITSSFQYNHTQNNKASKLTMKLLPQSQPFKTHHHNKTHSYLATRPSTTLENNHHSHKSLQIHTPTPSPATNRSKAPWVGPLTPSFSLSL